MSPRSDPALGSPSSGKGAEHLSRVKEETSPVMSIDNSVVIAGLGLRLAPQPTQDVRAACHSKSPDEGRVFVTELVNGGAAQRSNLLKQNDEILHVDHVQTKLRTVVYIPPSSQPAPACHAAAHSSHSGVDPSSDFHLFAVEQNDVKNAILGTPGTSVRIGIRRGGESFELSFVRGHTQERGSASKQPNSKDLSSATKGTPTAVATTVPSARPTPKALFRSSPAGKDAAVHAGTCLAEAARRGDMELVAKLAAEVLALARSGHAHSVRNLVLDDPASQSTASSHPVSRELDLDSEIKFQPHSVCVAHSPAGAEVSLVPTLQYDGMSPMPTERVSKVIFLSHLPNHSTRQLSQTVEPYTTCSVEQLPRPRSTVTTLRRPLRPSGDRYDPPEGRNAGGSYRLTRPESSVIRSYFDREGLWIVQARDDGQFP